MEDIWSEAERSIILEKDNNSLLIAEVDKLKNELDKARVEFIDYKARKEERWTTFIMFEYGFDEIVQQFKKPGYPPEGAPSNFISLSATLDDMLEEAFGK